MIPEGTALGQPHTNTMERSPHPKSLPAVPQPQGPGYPYCSRLTGSLVLYSRKTSAPLTTPTTAIPGCPLSGDRGQLPELALELLILEACQGAVIWV